MAWNLATVTPGAPASLVVPRIALCAPHWGSVSLEWADKMYKNLMVNQPDFEKFPVMMRGILNLDTERNQLVKAALKDPKMTHILFVDTDCIPESPPDPNVAIRMLLAVQVDIASGFYRAAQVVGFNPAMWAKDPSVPIGYAAISTWTGNWLGVDAIGLGFALFKRAVFEKIPYPWFQWFPDPTPSEDFDFCRKLKAAGYDIRVMTDVKLSHMKTLKIMPDGTFKMPEA